MFNVNEIRKKFPMFKVKMQGKRLVFFDNAATTFKPITVINNINKYYVLQTSNSQRGDYDLCYNVDKTILETRGLVAKFINAKTEEIIFTSGTTMSINLVAFGYGMYFLKSGDEILLTEAEHASNVLPWFNIAKITGAKIKFIPLTKDGRLTIKNVKKTVSKNTKIIAIALVTNVLGFYVPIKEITLFAHSKNIIVIGDGAQYVPHKRTNVLDLDIDFLSFSAHKMCGPTGIGILYGKKMLLEKMNPFLTGGGMNDSFDIKKNVVYLDPPEKFEAGTLNIAGIFGLKAAIEFLMKIGMKNIEEYEKKLRCYAINKMKKNKNIVIYNMGAEAPIITFNKKNVFAQDEATFLNSRGIAVRSGKHCAKMLDAFLKVAATLRVSFCFYNTTEEIDILIDALKEDNFLDVYYSK
ncbi:MAG: aminotransferase class V-fold PLP-dependent enzyme [Bacilli bacterium]|nr:aminotransferase class V-fold PLP-dependent enzyme [Bacilli bacterium]